MFSERVLDIILNVMLVITIALFFATLVIGALSLAGV